MGNPVPPTPWPPWIPTKWYCVHLLAYQDLPDYGCIGTAHHVDCCRTGAMIIAWVDYECISGLELCPFSGYSAQEVIDWTGPYDTYEECVFCCNPP